MSRIARAAKTLQSEVEALRKSATVETHGDPDGLGVHRTLKFDKQTSKWLEPMLAEISDSRISESHVTDDGYLHVSVVPTYRGDFTEPFNLAAAETVVKAAKKD